MPSLSSQFFVNVNVNQMSCLNLTSISTSNFVTMGAGCTGEAGSAVQPRGRGLLAGRGGGRRLATCRPCRRRRCRDRAPAHARAHVCGGQSGSSRQHRCRAGELTPYAKPRTSTRLYHVSDPRTGCRCQTESMRAHDFACATDRAAVLPRFTAPRLSHNPVFERSLRRLTRGGGCQHDRNGSIQG